MCAKHHVVIKNTTTFVHGLRLVLLFSPFHVDGAELQYQTQPINKGGAVSVKENDPFSNLIQLL